MRPLSRLLSVAAAAVPALLSTAASANRIHTGGETGAYHRDFCPGLAREMTSMGQPYTCTTSAGTRENMERIRANPRELAFGQLDVLALEGRARANLQIIRKDDARECVFAVTRNRDITSFGELAAYAPSSRIFLPPQTSGSAGTFQFLRSIDRNGLGRVPATSISNAPGGTDDAIRAALNRDDGIAFFVQYPDPDNERFKLVRDLGGHFVPVLDRAMLSQQVGDAPVYFAQETRIANSRRLELGGGRVTTACTPVVLFTGDSAAIRDNGERRLHQDLVTAVRAFPKDSVLPRQTPLRQAMERTRELTADGRQRVLAMTHRARDRALPFIERMIERAAPRFSYDDRD